MTAAVHISQVRKKYRQITALNNVEFDIPQGSFFGLLGPNGAGKSTLINIIGGLVQATSGTVAILGHDVRQEWRKARQIIGVVPQELVYDPFFSIIEMLRLQSGYFGYGKENYAWIDELLDILSLTDKADTNLQYLSGGMKRRVLIAQALVHKPPVVILDEPTAGVDVELRQMLWAFTKLLHQKGHTIVLTTHYLEEAEALCERIAILNQGQLIALDDTQVLLSRHPYKQIALTLTTPLISINNLPQTLHDKVLSLEGTELVIQLHREHDRVSDVLDTIRLAGIHFADLKTTEPSLEDVFLGLTGRHLV
ncbi:ABC transporter ATP-binding protein [Beggiatoa leptomitoformis]|uniref:ATP-binding cassette domain-containing protein n=1 Tax=Beggiatoa leptomitoformis TaxID=288004 RepID=A0A2N9YGH1_9GAMM|nr:ABC transporter ATP-binding protein [Beggiatoa leptomitoformis]ALG68103.1 ATP-binding cassette domain-containing protein [Beggiatoa leptomitoformis]AUI69600.1 ATP-binding cassette domain-containing protein [Beggiatoa leptomitoformis]